MALSTSGRAADPASGESSGKTRSDSEPTRRAGQVLWGQTRRGEETSLALLSALSSDQHHRQLAGEARLLADVLFTHAARFDRDKALDFLAELLDEHRRRVLPAVRETQNLSLFGKETR
jgi:hypothetical protein